MNAPRLEIDLGRIEHNARALVERLAARGISVTGVTKAVRGSIEIADALLRAGVSALGDSRIENIEAMRRGHVEACMTLIRSPMLSQAERVVHSADISFNTELAVIGRLADAARRRGRVHEIVLMVELGDLREGIMPAELEATVHAVLGMPDIVLAGIGANLACHAGISPDANNMAELSALADSIERRFDLRLGLVSGGNSANLDWALGGADTGRINNLRIGEAILLGCETLQRRPIEGLFTDAIVLVAEVIESKRKPARPWGTVAQAAFARMEPVSGTERMPRSILAIGHQDVDPAGLLPPAGVEIVGASGDHLIVCAPQGRLAVGDEVGFGVNYSALLRAMHSPFVGKDFRETAPIPERAPEQLISRA
ncbi:alanine/ornithine racemase family PLP-dependent enzyme [Wenzhouxiangella sp. EGI_FJ10409]|uniref:alanine/ornithine racemase family PLP-dependent enzyme n=1 Tax=Wenzhouxiangella sp. EGI_FJ10409 TaxID=3243767 RepID=UPI0035E2E23A